MRRPHLGIAVVPFLFSSRISSFDIRNCEEYLRCSRTRSTTPKAINSAAAFQRAASLRRAGARPAAQSEYSRPAATALRPRQREIEACPDRQCPGAPQLAGARLGPAQAACRGTCRASGPRPSDPARPLASSLARHATRSLAREARRAGEIATDARLPQCAVARLRSGARRGRRDAAQRRRGEPGSALDIEFADGHIEARADAAARKPEPEARLRAGAATTSRAHCSEAKVNALSPRSCWKRREQAGVARRLEVMVTDSLQRRATRS